MADYTLYAGTSVFWDAFDWDDFTWDEAVGNSLAVSGTAANLEYGRKVTAAAGHSVTFDGVDGYGSVSGLPDLATKNQFTVEVTMKSENPTWTVSGPGLSKRNQFIIYPAIGSTTIYFYVYAGGAWSAVAQNITTAAVGAEITDMNTYTFVWDDGAMDFYLNGVPIRGENVGPRALGSDTGAMTIARDDSIATYENITVDNIRIWDRSLNQDEILRNFHARLDGDEAGLVGYYEFEEGSGNTVADLSSGGNDMTLYGGYSWNDQAGVSLYRVARETEYRLYANNNSAMSFDGVDDYLYMYGMPDFSTGNEFTVEVVAASGTPLWSGYHGLCARYGQFLLSSEYNNRRIILYIHNGTAYQAYFINPDASIDITKPHRYTYTYKTGTAKLYIDGEYAGGTTSFGASLASSANVIMGSIWGSWRLRYTAQDYRIWDVERSADDIAADWDKRLTGTETNLVGYWPLNEGTHRTLRDEVSGNVARFIYDQRWVGNEFFPTLDLDGDDITVTAARTLSAESGTFTITGTAANLEYGREVDPASGSYTITGTAANLEYGRRLSADSGSFSVAGTAANTEYHRVLFPRPPNNLIPLNDGDGTRLDNWLTGVGTANATIEDGQFRLEMDGAAWETVCYPITTVVGEYYTSIFDIPSREGTGTVYAIVIKSDSQGSYGVNRIDLDDSPFRDGTHSITWKATATTTYIHILCGHVSGHIIFYDNIRTFPTQNLIAESDGDGSDISNWLPGHNTCNGNALFTSTGTSFKLENNGTSWGSYCLELDTVVGQKYTTTFNTYGHGGGGYVHNYVIKSDSQCSWSTNRVDIETYHNATAAYLQWQGKTWTATATKTYIHLLAPQLVGQYVEYDSIFTCPFYEEGSFYVEGTDANLEHHHVLSADSGSFAVSGTNANLEYGREVDPASGTYTVTGQDSSLEKGYNLSADAGSYSVTGTDADLDADFEVDPASGSFTVTGTAANLEIGYKVAADGTAYTVTGNVVNLLVDRPGGGDERKTNALRVTKTGEVYHVDFNQVLRDESEIVEIVNALMVAGVLE